MDICSIADCSEERAKGSSKCKNHRNEYMREYMRNRMDKEGRRNEYLLRQHKITSDQYESMLASQNGQCAICGTEPPKGAHLHVDHDHSCCSGKRSCGRCIRGLLCDPCNTGLARFRDNRDNLLKAVAYLDAARIVP